MAENRTGEQFSTTTLNLTHTHPPTLVSRSFKFAWWKCFSFTSRPSTLVFDHIRFTVSMARHRARRWATWRLRCRSVCVDFALFCLFVFGSTTMKCPQCEEVESGREWGTDTVVGRRERWETQVMLLAGGWSCWLVAGAVCCFCLLLTVCVLSWCCCCDYVVTLMWLMLTWIQWMLATGSVGADLGLSYVFIWPFRVLIQFITDHLGLPPTASPTNTRIRSCQADCREKRYSNSQVKEKTRH